MSKPNARLVLYSSLAIVVLVLMWGIRQIPAEGRLADQALRESLDQESIVLNSAVKTSIQAMKYRLLDVLKAEGNDHATRTFQDSPFTAVTLLEWDQVRWKNLWYSVKSTSELQATELHHWLNEWPLSKLSIDEVYFTKVADAMGQPHFAMLVPVRRPNQIPMVGVGIFPASQFGLGFSAGEDREIRVFDDKGMALALTHPAYLGSSLKSEALVKDILESDEVSVRDEWKAERLDPMIGLATRIPDSNLYAAIQTPAAHGSSFQSWMYLILSALGAGILNWVLFSSILRTALKQLTQSEEAIKTLRQKLTEVPAATIEAKRAPVEVEADEVIPAAALPKLDFTGTETEEDSEEQDVPSEETEEIGLLSIHKIVRAALRALDPKIRELKINVMYYGLDDLKVDGDPLQLQTALEEILKNAIEAMSESTDRNLTLSGRKDNHGLYLTIEDTGRGVDNENLAKVFDPFFSTKDSQGVARGLGLNVARRVIEELAGKIRLESESGKGTRVEIEWPLEKPAEIDAEALTPDPVTTSLSAPTGPTQPLGPTVGEGWAATAASRAASALNQLDLVIEEEAHRPPPLPIRKPKVRVPPPPEPDAGALE